MFFDDPSCSPLTTIEHHMDIGLPDLLGAEWFCLVSISFSGTTSFDASYNLHHFMDDNCYQELILKHKLSFLRNRQVCVSMSDEGFSILRYRIRSSTNYEVFYVMVRQGAPFTENECKWLVLYFSKAYSNVLLNHELFQQNEYIEGVFNGIEASIFVFDLNLQIVSYNSIGKGLLTGSTGTSFSIQDIPFLEPNEVYEAISAVIRQGIKQRLDNIIIKPKVNQERIFCITLTPLRNSKMETAGVVAVCTDSTKDKIMQQELSMLEQYGLLGEIALGISHDVKNPLMNIQSCTYILQKNWGKDIDYSKYFSLIASEITRINEIVNQMMSFGHINSANTSGLVNINEILIISTQIIERQKSSSRLQNVVIETHLSKKLPPFTARPFDLQQIFLNLMLNALQSIDSIGKIIVRSSYDKDNGRIAVTVSDNGCGISQKQMESIFQPYHTTKINGHGLGLFLTKRAVERYHGVLEISSQEGRGTVCTVLFPVDDV